MSLRPLLLAALLFAVTPDFAAAQEISALRHGVNLSSWLANAPRQPVFSRDFMQIRQAGFDHVRLPWNPEYVGFKLAEGNIGHIDFTPLDRALAQAEQAGLPVILDIHPGGDFVETLEKSAKAEDAFVTLWRTLAERYKDRAGNQLAFELLNEPQYYKAEARWTALTGRLVHAIHAVSPGRLIVVGAPHGSEIDGLSYLQPTDDPHIIYAFHFYEPYMVTHQGIHMGFEDKMLRYFRGVPYPSALATKAAAAYAPTATLPGQAQRELADYVDTGWNSTHIAARIRIAREWADAHHARVLCGEFGVLRNHIDPESRYRWIHDTRAAMDQNGIGWEIWDYADLFGIAHPVGATSRDPVDGSVRLEDPASGSYAFDAQALPALGLTQSGHP